MTAHAPPGPDRALAVSVIVPARDAEAGLPTALDSILAQDYPGEIEVIVADGSATPATRDLLRARYPGVRRVANPGRTIPCGLNRALGAARHGVIARCDASATLPPGYLRRAVATLRRTGAANVGGRMNPAGTTFFERTVALATRHPIGAGDARYRIGGAEGPVDTVFLGVFRREALEAAGDWDEAFERNEDYELNWRLRERGETVWFDPALAVDYRPRGTFGALARQYFGYGRWKAAMLARHPRSWRARQLAAPLLAAALAASAAGLAVPGPPLLAAAVPLAWALALLVAAAAIGARRRRAEALLVPAVAATIHLAWGLGFLAGLCRAAGRPAREAPGGGGGGGGDSGDALFSRTVSGFKWAFLGAAGQALLSLGAVTVLARLLTPAEYGLLAVALIFIALADTVGRRGLGPALIQRFDLTRRHTAAVFTLSLAAGLVLAAALWGFAPWLARLAGEPDAAPLLRTLSLATVFTGIGVASEHRLRRELRFRALAGASVLATGTGSGLVAITLALTGHGAAALAWGIVARQGVFALASLALAPPPRTLGAGRREVGDLLRTGAGLSTLALLTVLSDRSVNLVVARALGADALGLYTRARALSVAPARVGPLLGHVLLPAMARRQHQTGRMRGALLDATEILSLAALPLSALIALGAPEIVAAVLGAQWDAAVPALRILALAGAVQVFNALHVPVIRAKGAVWREAWRRALFLALLPGGVWFASRWGLEGAVCAIGAVWAVQYALLAQLALGLLGLRWRTLLRRHVPALWAALWATAALWLTTGVVRGAAVPAPLGLALELAAWGGAAAAAVYFAPPPARPAFPHWGLERLAFDAAGRPGRWARGALEHLARRWPAPHRT